MNDETNKEVATIMFRASKLTAEALAEAMESFIGAKKDGVSSITDAGSKPMDKHGKMRFKDLVAQNEKLDNIEIPHDGVGDFVAIAKKYHIDFAIKKDKSMEPPTYYCFFKARDSTVLEAAMNEFIAKQERAKNMPSFHQMLESIREVVNKHRERAKERQRQREKAL